MRDTRSDTESEISDSEKEEDGGGEGGEDLGDRKELEDNGVEEKSEEGGMEDKEQEVTNKSLKLLLLLLFQCNFLYAIALDSCMLHTLYPNLFS